ncbi:Tim10/DDP family zinc finger-domain-containing protein [Sphaerosporella brunnea]|uniref:Mitochondrial import inner membrane translocase subunit n=1 Tax=Sphaerosporella brunnea TaxID=1250544 RepID=A0A5J5F406_9PEZI|nr:Tim10/DDP family zinc finger-domain-containing protein [Sphaerosporella brunnea]
MDSSLNNPSLGEFNEKDRKELQQFFENQQQKAKFQDNVHSLTSMCWTKCIAANKISGPQVDRSEASCLENCVNRFIDAQKAVISQLEKIGSQ